MFFFCKWKRYIATKFVEGSFELAYDKADGRHERDNWSDGKTDGQAKKSFGKQTSRIRSDPSSKQSERQIS